MRVDSHPGYVLHSRHYRDSSVLLDVLTAQHGRISLVARGARRQSKRGSKSALLQPFVPLLVSFSGRGELKTLIDTEAAGPTIALRGKRLYSGLYLNELLVRLLHRDDPHPPLFASYGETVAALEHEQEIDRVLRYFELGLLRELGYFFDLEFEGDSGAAIEAGQDYYFDPARGLCRSTGDHVSGVHVFTGSELLGFARGQWSDTICRTAKLLLRSALAEHLGGVPLRSRELFREQR